MNTQLFTGAERFPGAPTPSPAIADLSDMDRAPLITQYLAIAMRWKWLILACVALALAAGALFTLLATPQFTATTRLEITREATRIVNVQGVEPETTPIDAEFYQTQYGLLESHSLAERVVRQLRLADDKAFFARFGRDDLFDSQSDAERVHNRSEREKVAADILLDHLAVNPIRLSRLVDVSFTSSDPAFSAQVANAWSTAFIEANLERRFAATAYARKFLEDRLGQIRQRLEESERKLVGYASKEAIINIPVGSNREGQTEERSLTADSLATLNQALAQAVADRVAAESRLRRTSGTSREDLSNTTLGTLREQRAQAAAEYSRLMTQFEPGYPAAKALAAQIATLDRSIAAEEGRGSNLLQADYRNALEREQRLRERVNALKGEFLDQRTRSIDYNILQRDVDTNRELYNGLLQRYKEIGVAGGVGNNNVSVVDPAAIPTRPSSPRVVLNLLLALLGGLAVGIGLAVVRSQMDETVSDPGSVEAKVGIPLLGAIPMTRGEDPQSELLDPKSGLAEAYLSVQSSLAFTSDHGIPRTFGITSTRAGEGKSTTAFALANAIARSGARTILIDGDMRSPSVNENVGISNRQGLSNFLTGQDDFASLIQRVEAYPMEFLTAGPSPANAAELLRGSRFETLLRKLTQEYDHVVVDSPPVLGLADAPIIGSQVEGMIFVVQAGEVKAGLARRALNRLVQSRTHVLGAVLTRFDPRQTMFGYDYGYGYGYGSRYGSAEPQEAVG